MLVEKWWGGFLGCYLTPTLELFRFNLLPGALTYSLLSSEETMTTSFPSVSSSSVIYTESPDVVRKTVLGVLKMYDFLLV